MSETSTSLSSPSWFPGPSSRSQGVTPYCKFAPVLLKEDKYGFGQVDRDAPRRLAAGVRHICRQICQNLRHSVSEGCEGEMAQARFLARHRIVATISLVLSLGSGTAQMLRQLRFSPDGHY